MNIAVCDDEENMRMYLKSLIRRQDAGCRIREFSSGGELLRFFKDEENEPPDIVFLDISMNGTDGMEAAKQIQKRKEESGEPVWGSLPLLIFVTGYPEYMPEAFFVNAFQYLVKPVSEKTFKAVFTKAVRECRRLEQKKNAGARQLLLKNKTVTRAVAEDDIYYIESSNRKIIVYMKNEKIECYGKIGELEMKLKDSFFRIHKGYLVNMKYVEQYNRTEVRLKNGSSLMISKYKYQDFIKAYLEYISEE